MLRARLIPLTLLVQTVSDLSRNIATVPEVFEILPNYYDARTMMIYDGRGVGLADPLDGNSFSEKGGISKREDIVRQLFNSRCWERVDAEICTAGDRLSPHELSITIDVATVLARRLWTYFLPNKELDERLLQFKLTDPSGPTRIDKKIALALDDVAVVETNPNDLPAELDAAMLGFRAVSNGFGDATATFRNRLIDYLHTTYPGFKSEQVQRIATIANPDRTPGRKRRYTK